MNIFIEYVIVFLFVLFINYITLVKNRLKNKKKDVPPELIYLKKIYNINLKNINYKNFVYIYSFVNTFIISTIYIIIMYLINNWVLKIIVGIVLLVLLIIICYGIMGRYYLWKEGNDDV